MARRAGVTHAAATYHFGNKAGLVTAIATEGYQLLGHALHAARSQGSFLDTGIAYVRFAVGHRAHFEVMFRPELYRASDPALRQARAAAADSLYGSSNPDDSHIEAGVAAWSLMHGLVTLWLNGNLPGRLGDDPEQIARAVAVHLQVADSPQPASP